MAGRFRPRRRGLVALSAAAGLLVVGWLATTPWLVGHWPRVLAVRAVPVRLRGPALVRARPLGGLAGRGRTTRRPGAGWRTSRLKLQNDVRIGLLQAVAGVAVIAAVVVTWQQLETDRRQLRQQLEVAGSEQAGERFAQRPRPAGQRAAGRPPRRHLRAGADRRPGPGGGRGGGRRRLPPAGVGRPAVGVLGVPGPGPGVRDPVRLCPDDLAPPADRARRVATPTLQTRQPDVNAAVTVLARRTVLDGDPPLDLSGSLLPGARLGWARLAGADLRGADLRGTSLQHAELAGVAPGAVAALRHPVPGGRPARRPPGRGQGERRHPLADRLRLARRRGPAGRRLLAALRRGGRRGGRRPGGPGPSPTALG